MPNLQTKKAVRESEAEKGSVLQPSGKKRKKERTRKKSALLFHWILIEEYIGNVSRLL